MYRVLVGKPEGKRPLWKPRRKWVDIIRTDIQEVGCGYMEWIGLAQDRDNCRTLPFAAFKISISLFHTVILFSITSNVPPSLHLINKY